MNQSKAQKIKAILFDVDGVLTDGGIIYDDNGLEYKRFNVKDGLIMAHLRRSGIVLGVITGRKSQVVELRMRELDIDFQAYGVKDKSAEFNQFKNKYDLQNSEIAYIGDDINDLPLLTRCGFSGCPADAPQYVKDRVNLVLQRRGGDGAFREFADYILDSKGLLSEILQKFSD